MTLSFLSRLAGVLALSGSLAGCLDATVDVQVLDEATGTLTMTQVMGADFYAMVKSGMGAGETETEFCEGGSLTEGADGSATCVISRTGAFSELSQGDAADALVVTSAGPGLVRVAFPTGEMTGEINNGQSEIDAETRAMLGGVFAGHAITLRVSGGEVTESNMTTAADKRSAEQIIPFLDLINAEADIPDEFFAVLKID